MAPDRPQQLVVFSLGAEEYALPIGEVQEIIHYTEPRSVASKAPWIRGVISLRGKIIPVCDLATRLGVASNAGEASKIVVVERESGIAGVIEIAGIEGRLRPTTGANYGYLGFLAAWMAWNHPLRLVATSFLLGMIAVAGNSLEMNSGLPSSSVHILMALVLIFLLAGGRIGRGRRA